MALKLLSIDRVLNKEDIYGKIMHQKLVPDPILNSKYNLKPLNQFQKFF